MVALLRQIVQTEVIMANTTQVSSNSSHSQLMSESTDINGINRSRRQFSINDEGQIGQINSQSSQSKMTSIDICEEASQLTTNAVCSHVFKDMRAFRDDVYNTKKAIYDQILELTPQEYSGKIDRASAKCEEYEEHVQRYIDKRHVQVEDDYDAFPAALQKARSLISEEEKGLMTFPVERFISSVPPGKPSRLSQGKNSMSKERLTWNLHFLYDNALECKERFDAANESYSVNRVNIPEEFKALVGEDDQKKDVRSKSEVLQTEKRDYKRNKANAVLECSYQNAEKLDLFKDQRSDFDGKVADYIQRKKCKIKKSKLSKTAEKKEYIDLNEKVENIKRPPFYTKSLTPAEAKVIRKIDSELRQLNAEIEKHKRNEGSVKYKMARAKHNLVMPQKYKLNPADSSGLVQTKNRFNTLQQEKLNVLAFVDSRQAKDTELVKFLAAADSILDAFDDLKYLSRR